MASPLTNLAELLVATLMIVTVVSPVAADGAETERTTVSKQTVRKAATRAIRLIEKSSMNMLKHRQCSTCHHQTLTDRAE